MKLFERNHYSSVRLSLKGNVFNKTIHRLVAEHFIPNPENKPQVNHIDGNKLNNHVSNLEWNTSQENVSHALKNGLYNVTGTNNPFSKLDEKTVLNIRDYYKNNKITFKELSLKFNISLSSAHKIINRVYWSHI